jgi:hypothetical protein
MSTASLCSSATWFGCSVIQTAPVCLCSQRVIVSPLSLRTSLVSKDERVQDSRADALQAFTRQHAEDARALVQASHRADQGFVYFVLPIILDANFHKAAPWLFSPSTMKLMQLRNWRYSQVQRKKRLDRLLQVAIIGSVLSALAYALFRLAKTLLLKLTGGGA